MGECSPDMAGIREIKYPGRTKTSTAALQFDIGLSRAGGRKPWPKITWSNRLGVDTAGQPPAKKPIGNNLDGCNLRRHKLCKMTIRLSTLNVQGLRNKTGEIVKSFGELKQDIILNIRGFLKVSVIYILWELWTGFVWLLIGKCGKLLWTL
jgi:hypothetical protein